MWESQSIERPTLHEFTNHLKNAAAASFLAEQDWKGSENLIETIDSSVDFKGQHSLTAASFYRYCFHDPYSTISARAALSANYQHYVIAGSEKCNAIYVAFRGSCDGQNWWSESEKDYLSNKHLGALGASHKGLVRRLKPFFDENQVLSRWLLEIPAAKCVVFCGHSLGGSMAVLATACCLSKVPRDRDLSFLCITLGAPLCCDLEVVKRFSNLAAVGIFHHIVVRNDTIPIVFVGGTVSSTGAEYMLFNNSNANDIKFAQAETYKDRYVTWVRDFHGAAYFPFGRYYTLSDSDIKTAYTTNDFTDLFFPRQRMTFGKLNESHNLESYLNKLRSASNQFLKSKVTPVATVHGLGEQPWPTKADVQKLASAFQPPNILIDGVEIKDLAVPARFVCGKLHKAGSGFLSTLFSSENYVPALFQNPRILLLDYNNSILYRFHNIGKLDSLVKNAKNFANNVRFAALKDKPGHWFRFWLIEDIISIGYATGSGQNPTTFSLIVATEPSDPERSQVDFSDFHLYSFKESYDTPKQCDAPQPTNNGTQDTPRSSIENADTAGGVNEAGPSAGRGPGTVRALPASPEAAAGTEGAGARPVGEGNVRPVVTAKHIFVCSSPEIAQFWVSAISHFYTEKTKKHLLVNN